MKSQKKIWMRRAILTWAIALLAIGAPIALSAQTSSAQSDQDKIRQLLDKYAQSVDTLDIQLISEIWSHDAQVSFIHPLGTEIGLDQIETNLFGKIMGLFSKRELLLENPIIHVQGDAAWSEMTWTFHATWKNDGTNITTTGRETQIYAKENGVWHLVHVHYSGPPISNVRKGV